MAEPTWVTVAEAALLTGRSKALLYRLIEDGLIRPENSNAGMLLNLSRLRQVLANRRKPGRPRRAA